VLLNYHIGHFVLSSLCVGDLVRLGLSSVLVAGFSLHQELATVLLNYHISRFVLSSLCVGDMVQLQPATWTLLKPSCTKSPTHNEPRTKRPMW